MNDEGMKRRQRFMALQHIEYVWLSAVWWRQLSLSDRHMERNQLNDSIPPEKSQEERFFFVCLILAFSQALVCLFSEISGNVVTKTPQKVLENMNRGVNIMQHGTVITCLTYTLDVQEITKRQTVFYQLWWDIFAFGSRFDSWYLNLFSSMNNFWLVTKWLSPSADSSRSHSFCLCLHSHASWKVRQ